MPPRFERVETHRPLRTYDDILAEVNSLRGVPQEKIGAALLALQLYLPVDENNPSRDPLRRERLQEALAQIGVTLKDRGPREM